MSTFFLGALISECCLCQSTGRSLFPAASCPAWVSYSHSEGVHCHSAQVAGPPGADGGGNAQSLLGRVNLLLTGV